MRESQAVCQTWQNSLITGDQQLAPVSIYPSSGALLGYTINQGSLRENYQRYDFRTARRGFIIDELTLRRQAAEGVRRNNGDSRNVKGRHLSAVPSQTPNGQGLELTHPP
jgi:hypothetical protein